MLSELTRMVSSFCTLSGQSRSSSYLRGAERAEAPIIGSFYWCCGAFWYCSDGVKGGLRVFRAFGTARLVGRKGVSP